MSGVGERGDLQGPSPPEAVKRLCLNVGLPLIKGPLGPGWSGSVGRSIVLCTEGCQLDPRSGPMTMLWGRSQVRTHMEGS